MAYHGKVLDLFQDKYLRLQDVKGDVAPFPGLVPYEDCSDNIIVYKMDAPTCVFLALTQDFTDRISRKIERELWTWVVQWKVGHPNANTPGLSDRTKKMRLDSPTKLSPTFGAQRLLSNDLIQEEDLLRILLDIVQCHASMLPNYIEFLYRWIDTYEGDGYALQCAIRDEIPNLWDFERHPVEIPQQKGGGTSRNNGDGQESGRNDLEDWAEESERLRYREVKYGLRVGTDSPGLVRPLFNLPRSRVKRNYYFAMCHRSRMTALHLLYKAGITVEQARNFVRGQELHPKDTSKLKQDGARGLERLINEEPYYSHNKYTRMVYEKCTETEISNRLATEAEEAHENELELAVEGGGGTRNVPPPLILPTAMHGSHLPATNAAKEKKSEWFEHAIKSVPNHLLGRLKSAAFVHARPQMPDRAMGDDSSMYAYGSDDDQSSTDYEYEGDDIDPMERDENNYNNNVGAGNVSFANNTLPVGFQQQNPVPTNSHQLIYNAISSYHQAAGANLQAMLNAHNQHLAFNSALHQPPPFPPNPSIPATAGPQIPPPLSAGFNSATIPFISAYASAAQQFAAFNNANNVQANMFGHTHQAWHQQPQPQMQHHHMTPQHPIVHPSAGIVQQDPLGTNVHAPGMSFPPPSININPPATHPPLGIGLNRPGINRTPPAPLNLAPPPPTTARTIAAAFARRTSTPQTARLSSPFSKSIPILVYFPKVMQTRKIVVVPERTDAVMLGHFFEPTGEIRLSHAMFLPAQINTVLLRRVRNGDCTVLETYSRNSFPGAAGNNGVDAHRLAYDRLVQAAGLMTSSKDREGELTKRWRASGRGLAGNRGAVWEGWAAYVDKEIGLSASEREGAFRLGATGEESRYGLKSARMEEMDALLDDDEEGFEDMDFDFNDPLV
ncbi:hypothetical protein BU24DRAFT_248834 [Aaosphaeria arxii CBS 175.79]|uniref:Uncharacterized protein n=1 Tax=Aaosphaeria arxii CBS 175.79 TaxID=1450172 RepID=A0A6A5XM26_9PLEO|nr:uncharacterized protein BU24DRAFT_248834 [Aaosphaeria arxii CBS 175.79]KAF2013861.1 hypothetical protein BU24DRAFT_248834 [Aaosphaeria arxii CBS 175.79]